MNEMLLSPWPLSKASGILQVDTALCGLKSVKEVGGSWWQGEAAQGEQGGEGYHDCWGGHTSGENTIQHQKIFFLHQTGHDGLSRFCTKIS